MKSRGAFLFLILLLAEVAGAVIPSSRTSTRAFQKPPPSLWSAQLQYLASTDMADRRTPRAYAHSVGSTFGYTFKPHHQFSADLSLSPLTVDGQIPKQPEQSELEVLNPSTSFGYSYSQDFSPHSYSLGLSAEPLWNEPSRREGHMGILGASGDVTLRFIRHYDINLSLDVSTLLNTYKYGSNQRTNPDYFTTAKWVNVFKFLDSWSLSLFAGLKVTRYLDGYVGYAYNNGVVLGHSWNKSFSSSLSYTNGGFTDDGYVQLWYLDEYRRTFKLRLAYAF